jgi:hypothetical protein
MVEMYHQMILIFLDFENSNCKRERVNRRVEKKLIYLFCFLFQSSIISKEQRQFNENIFHELRASKSLEI